MTFLECCQTVREHGLRMIRPREHTPGLYDIREPFEAGAGWVWLDATTANVVCQIFDALSPDRQEMHASFIHLMTNQMVESASGVLSAAVSEADN